MTEHFNLAELTRSVVAETMGIDNKPDDMTIANLHLLAVNVLEPLRKACVQALHVSSGYRSPALNEAIGGAPGSQHITGQAADVYTPNISPRRLGEIAIEAGINFDQLIVEENWLHISYDQFRNRRQALVKHRDGFDVLHSPNTIRT